MAKTNGKTVWLGEVEIHGYPVICIAETSEECKRLLIKEHRKQHETAQTGTYASDWEQLEDMTDASVRMVVMGTVVWP